MNSNQKQNEEYISMINYLINHLNKAKLGPSILNNNQKLNTPIFLYEFFVYELYIPSEIFKFIKQPMLCFRLFDFPTLSLEGTLNPKNESIIFNQGKSSYFEMEIDDIKDKLIKQPLYIMFIDLNYGNINVIGNCRLNISLFSFDTFINYGIDSKGPEPRKNFIQLFDNTMQKIAEFEFALLIKREYYKFDKNIEMVEDQKRSYLIKKAKKSRDPMKNYKETKSDFFCIEGKEKPKNEKPIKNNKNYIKFGDNNDINVKKGPQPQYVNNFILEGKDQAFNAHPVNKVIIIGGKNKGEDDPLNKEKKKKRKVKNTSDFQTQTDELEGVDVPINQVNYHKKEKPKRKIYNTKPNNDQLFESMYKKIKNNNQYNFNYSNYNNQNLNYNNNKNIGNDQLFFQTNGIYNNTNMSSKQNNNSMLNNTYKSNNENSPKKSEQNEYLKLVLEIKSKVGAYKEKLINEQNNIQKIKEERNINTNLLNIEQSNEINNNFNNNINNNQNNCDNNTQKYCDNNKINNNFINEDNNNNNYQNNNNDNFQNDYNNQEKDTFINSNFKNNDVNNIDINNNINENNENYINNNLNNNIRQQENNNDLKISENNEEKRNNDIDINIKNDNNDEVINSKKNEENNDNLNNDEINRNHQKSNNEIIGKQNSDSDNFEEDFEPNISQSNIQRKESTENFASGSFGLNSQSNQRNNQRSNDINDMEKQENKDIIKEEPYDDFESDIKSKKSKISEEIQGETQNNNSNNYRFESNDIPEESQIKNNNRNIYNTNQSNNITEESQIRKNSVNRPTSNNISEESQIKDNNRNNTNINESSNIAEEPQIQNNRNQSNIVESQIKKNSIIRNESQMPNNTNEEVKPYERNENKIKHRKKFSESEVVMGSVNINKFSNLDYDSGMKDNYIQEVNEEKEKSVENSYNIGSQSQIKEDSSLMRNQNNDGKNLNEVKSGEITEDIKIDSLP